MANWKWLIHYSLGQSLASKSTEFSCSNSSIPVRSLNQEDRLIWHYTRNGVYTVKSAYRLAMERIEKLSQVCVLCDGEIENLWRTLVNCEFAQQCWHAAKLSHAINHAANSCESISEWLFLLLDNLQGYEMWVNFRWSHGPFGNNVIANFGVRPT